ncbi:hypothetical protein MPTK1_6g10720 [Marchantia polymorpha subsp. ruderalis]|uniref:GRPD C-terminal domain-containing protein n=2 Tax=Marchantia polymorpha TaxID=3197 RepID=A0A176WBK7_MARPO|nr:hypothetical protein AXG93_4003s1380 [Marchantia polymorpha subsp. ruderalis]PTQ45062.1 hypothetical protein MARPO_0016s0113 [Marchantia polymorpha]BBN14328.1 hypothetical protein Mp_6g10720 [Marchantia polymorpha subsp. ruderalis]|eukprot:PTQ45062.1 hypothetical protein MARPO_0016s0113 [Marchantia polymorpha]
MSERKSVEIISDAQLNWNTAQSFLGSKFDADLIASAKEQVRFLALVKKTPALRRPEVLKCAIHRYWNNYLPLAAKFQSKGFPDAVLSKTGAHFVPPLDCAWIWHCHKLSPVRYASDCRRLFGEIIDIRTIPSEGTEINNSERDSCTLWQMEYPDEPYHLVQPWEDGTSMEFQNSLNRTPKESSLIESYNLEDAAARQAPFYFQVQRSWFTDDGYLEGALQRYKGYLFLIQQSLENRMAKDRPVFIVPTYDIDLIWHSHQLHPIAYARHTRALFGTILDHDDTDTDRGEGAKLHSSFLETCDKWWATFGTVYERAGAMYRGPEPQPIPQSPDNDPKALEEERRLLEFTYKGRWNSSSFDSHMESCAEDSPDAYLRSIFQVHLVVLGARNLPHPSTRFKEKFCVRVTTIKNCKALRTYSAAIKRSPFGDHAEWNYGLAMEAERGTEGLQFEVCYHRFRKELFAGRCFPSKSSPYNYRPHNIVKYGSPMKKNEKSDTQILGKVSIPWSDLKLHSSKPDQWTTKSMVLDLLPVKLDISISVTPSQPGPKLLRALRSPVTDDSCKRIARDIDSDAPLQSGRWTTKIVVNYTGEPLYVIRTRSAHLASGAPASLQCTWEDTIVQIHQAECVSDGVTTAGAAIATAKPLVSEFHKAEKDQVQQWSLLNDGAILTVRKPPNDRPGNLDCEIHGRCGPHPMRLLSGRRIDYATADETSTGKFLTLVRYTPDAPRGKATALLSLSSACFEIMPGESSVLVLVICSAVNMSMHDFGIPIHSNNSINYCYSEERIPDRNGDQIGAIRVLRNQLSAKWSTPLPSDVPEVQAIRALYQPWWQLGGDFWPVEALGQGQTCWPAACAGAACGGNRRRPAYKASSYYDERRGGGAGGGCRGGGGGACGGGGGGGGGACGGGGGGACGGGGGGGCGGGGGGGC